ncbi:hypothetical protein [Streptomyces sp. BK208]|uniref:hypothetical protein n=1 Tax=Streptomyces sp. BK208 TaxID=2512150 RepID=UPI001FB90E06|nr:hypothetical protein [Streptomyces sp. BK208]
MARAPDRGTGPARDAGCAGDALPHNRHAVCTDEAADRPHPTRPAPAVRRPSRARTANGACDALVAGLDSPALRIPAACTRAEADYDVPDPLPPALDELGLALHPAASAAGREGAVRALATLMPDGEPTPREPAFRVHQRLGHEFPPAEPLARLDDEYDLLAYDGGRPTEVDAEDRAEALRLARHPRPDSGRTG